MASSALADIDSIIPNVVRESVKATVIHEITKRDQPATVVPPPFPSTSSSSVNGSHGNANQQVNGSAGSSSPSQTTNHTEDPHFATHHGPFHYHRRFPQTQSDIDTHLSPIPEDPLVDWDLHRRPTFTTPPQVAPLSPRNDPFLLVRPETAQLSSSIRRHLLRVDHPVLRVAAEHLFRNSPGKLIRPTMMFLWSRCLAVSGSSTESYPLPSQRRLADITESLHTASLFHDDVIDESDARRGHPTAHARYGNKMAILAGDFLLARASRALARLRDVTVLEMMSLIMEHLVRGEVMQMQPLDNNDQQQQQTQNEQHLEYYLRKTFYKTGSLMAQSCMSTAILSAECADPRVVEACYRYGKHVGMAFQLVDDVLDFEGDPDTMGKPALGDLNAGLATAPVLFTMMEEDDDESESSLATMVARKFNQDGDVERTLALVQRGNGIQQTKDLARVHAEKAIEAVMELDVGSSSSEGEDDDERKHYRDALVHLAIKVVDRTR